MLEPAAQMCVADVLSVLENPVMHAAMVVMSSGRKLQLEPVHASEK